MQYLDGLDKPRHIHNPECPSGIPDPNFSYALPDCGYWLPVVRLPTTLHLEQLVASLAPSLHGKFAQLTQSTTTKVDRFGFFHDLLIQYFV